MQQPPGGWGPQQPPQGYGHGYGHGYHPQQGYGPPQYPPQPPKRGMSGAGVVLLILVGAIVLGFGGCMMCVCIGAKGSSAPTRAEEPTLEQKCGGRHDLSSECRARMTASLTHPRSADFAGILGSSFDTAPDCTQTYRSSVESKNGLGLVVETEFMCTYSPKTGSITFKVLR